MANMKSEGDPKVDFGWNLISPSLGTWSELQRETNQEAVISKSNQPKKKCSLQEQNVMDLISEKW